MESLSISIDPAAYDRTLHPTPGMLPLLPENGDLEAFVKPKATVNGKAGVVITFTVTLPDGSPARVQAVTTAALLATAGMACKGWIDGGHI